MSIFEEFQEFRKVLCVCPCCGELVRVSDLKLKVKGPSTHTWLDDFEAKILAIQENEKKFEEEKGKIREESVEKGRKEAEKAILNMMSPGMKAMKLDPFDIKPISNPVDFVVFKGMTKKEDKVDDIMFLAKNIDNTELNKLRNQVKNAISAKKYDWQVARIDENGKIIFE
jgi:predicted Holliday junction resolvase-like endonuclease